MSGSFTEVDIPCSPLRYPIHETTAESEISGPVAYFTCGLTCSYCPLENVKMFDFEKAMTNLKEFYRSDQNFVRKQVFDMFDIMTLTFGLPWNVWVIHGSRYSL